MRRPLTTYGLAAVVAFAVAAACSCGHVLRGNDNDSVAVDSVVNETQVSDLTDFAWFSADSALASMTLEERVGQLFMPTIYSRFDSATLRKLKGYIHDLHVGGVVLLKGDLESAARISEICGSARIPLFVAIDAEWGLGMRLVDAPAFPRNGCISPQADEELLFEYGAEVARECRRTGIGMVLGPVIDVVENPNGIIGSRSFGSDPVRVADLGVAYARGLESGGVISVAKHFPGHGSPEADSHKSLPVISKSLHQLDSVDLYPFHRYIESGLSALMVGHLAVPAVDPYGLPAAVSAPVIQDLLKGELGFQGLVLTDALNMAGAEGYGAAKAIEAGADIIVGPENTAAEIAGVIDAVGKREISVREIDDRVRRVLFYKMLLQTGHVRAPELRGLCEDVSAGADSLRHRLLPSDF